MALNTWKMSSNGIEIAYFFKNLQKIAQRLAPVCDTFGSH